MDRQPDYWSGWMEGWAAATTAIFTAQQRGANLPPHAPRPALEMSRPEAAGNKPAGKRPRGRPPKSATLAAAPAVKRPRGRPPKNRPA